MGFVKKYKNACKKDKIIWDKVGANYTKLNWLTGEHRYEIAKYINLLRADELMSQNKSIFGKIFLFIIKRKRYRLGTHLGIFIPNNTCGEGLTIWHYGSIIVNANALIGRNCQMHGNNCIGNKGGSEREAPQIGDNVDIGYGAVILGGIRIANGIKIGANSVVTKSFEEENITIVGAPARKINK